jgi:hypothetical protein
MMKRVTYTISLVPQLDATELDKEAPQYFRGSLQPKKADGGRNSMKCAPS